MGSMPSRCSTSTYSISSGTVTSARYVLSGRRRNNSNDAPRRERRALTSTLVNDAEANHLFQDVLTATRLQSDPIVGSIPVRASAIHDVIVIHILPLRRAAHEIFSGGDLLIAATAVRATALVPEPAILMGLFDLSPAEVKLATALASGCSVQYAAHEAGVTLSNARTRSGSHIPEDRYASAKPTRCAA